MKEPLSLDPGMTSILNSKKIDRKLKWKNIIDLSILISGVSAGKEKNNSVSGFQFSYQFSPNLLERVVTDEDRVLLREKLNAYKFSLCDASNLISSDL